MRPPAALVRMRRAFTMLITSPDVRLTDLLGGRRGLADIASPHLLYLMVYVITRQLTVALLSAVCLAIVVTLVRVVRRQRCRQALGGLAMVGLSALLAEFTGHAVDFYLPHLIRGAVWTVLLVLSVVVRWPLVGIAVGPAIGGRTPWRRDPGLLRAYQLCTGLWAGISLVRAAVYFPLYFTNNVVLLGVTFLLLGVPLFAATLYLALRILRRAYSTAVPARSERPHANRSS